MCVIVSDYGRRLLLYLRRFELPLFAWAAKTELYYHLTMRALGVDDFNDHQYDKRHERIVYLSIRSMLIAVKVCTSSFAALTFAAEELSKVARELYASCRPEDIYIYFPDGGVGYMTNDYRNGEKR
jgi:hypothetical protein